VVGLRHYFQPRYVRVAVTAGDSALLRDRAAGNNAEYIGFVESAGSPANRELVQKGETDIAVVQGGIKLPDNFDFMGVVRVEHVLYFVRDAFPPRDGELPHVITFSEEQGSHVLGGLFFDRWGYSNVEWIHAWGAIATDEDYAIPADAHAVFVVIDPADPTMERAIQRVAKAGFRLRDPEIGVHATHLSYLKRISVDSSYYCLDDPTIPDEELQTYTVDNYLVAGRPLTYRQRLAVVNAFGLSSPEEELSGTVLWSRGVSLMADLDHILAVAVNFVVIMAGLLGVEVLLYRRYIHELNSLVSRVSLLQAECDLFGIKEKSTAEYNRLFLDACADLLGLISTIAGYYGKENAALMLNRYTRLIHTRANTLKINIQLKLLHPCFGDSFLGIESSGDNARHAKGTDV